MLVDLLSESSSADLEESGENERTANFSIVQSSTYSRTLEFVVVKLLAILETIEGLARDGKPPISRITNSSC